MTRTWCDRAGTFHSDAYTGRTLHSHQPLRLTYEVTIETRRCFSRPGKMSMPVSRRWQKNAQLLRIKEWSCGKSLYGHLRKPPKQVKRRFEMDELVIYRVNGAWPVMIASSAATCTHRRQANRLRRTRRPPQSPARSHVQRELTSRTCREYGRSSLPPLEDPELAGKQFVRKRNAGLNMKKQVQHIMRIAATNNYRRRRRPDVRTIMSTIAEQRSYRPGALR